MKVTFIQYIYHKIKYKILSLYLRKVYKRIPDENGIFDLESDAGFKDCYLINIKE